MNYLSGQYGMSYHRVSYSERVYDTIGLHGHRPYYSFAGNQLATGGVGSYGQPFWMNQSHSGQHLIGHTSTKLSIRTSTKLSIRTLAKLSTSLGNVQVTVSDLPYRKSIDGENLYQAALKSVYTSTKLSTSDYYPFGSLMPGRTVMDTTVHCVDMTQIDRVWQPAYENGLPFNSLFSEMSPWGAASYELSSDYAQLDLFIEDEQSGIKLLLDSGIGSGSLVLEGKVLNISDRGIVLRVQGVDPEGNGVVYHQEHLGQFDGKMEIPLDSAYSDYVVNIQGLLHWSILDNEIVNGHWVDPVDQISVSNYAVFRNSPVSFVDPKGNYSKLGAHLRSFLTGGSKVSYDEIYDTWTYNKGTKNGIIYKTGLSAKEQSKRIGNYEKPHFEMEGDRNGGFWKGVVEAHEAFWNSSLSRAIIPDKISIGIGGNVAAFAGTGTQPINISILTRGKEPGVYLTPTFNLNAGYGAIVSGGFEFTTSYYTGNPRNITASMLQGSTYGIMASGGYIGVFH